MRKNISPSKVIEDFSRQKKTPVNSFNSQIEFFKRNPLLQDSRMFKFLTPEIQEQAIKDSKKF
jgi:hypothetical protein